MIKTTIKNNFSADNIGMASSSLCLIHCIITPFVFIVQACTKSCCADSPLWWKAIDFLFLIISFVAVYFAAKSSSKLWIRIAFYILLSTLSFLVVNHHAGIARLPVQLLYVSAFLLFALHLYNKKCCQRSTTCCKT